jgi:exodeoxyribonuclease VII large subunit
VVSAIGHEPDSPLLDLVADVRCSTPTDAGKRVVPDVHEELVRVQQVRDRGRRAVRTLLARELAALHAARSRPVLADPRTLVEGRRAEVEAAVERMRRCTQGRLTAASGDLEHTRARVLALSPQATLDRGYAVVQTADGAVVRDPADVALGERLRLRVARGELGATAG